jgi:mannose-6-phosphate isomerase-like protein (cupin superfamily)
MKVYRMETMKGGWFIGNFEPTAHKTNDFEVSVKLHPQGEKWDVHYHKIAREINAIISGNMTLQNTHLHAGDIFVLEPGEIADPIFHTDCTIVCVKTPSVLNDKYSITTKE